MEKLWILCDTSARGIFITAAKRQPEDSIISCRLRAEYSWNVGGQSHLRPRPWSAATAPRNVSPTAVTTWRRYCFLSRLLRAPKKPTRRLLMTGPPGPSSALIRRSTPSTRGWALCRHRSLLFPRWRACRCTASYFTNISFFLSLTLLVALNWRQLCF